MGDYKPSLKTALSIDEQIKLLESRDLIILDRIYAKEVLERISYYRLSGYLLPFKTKQSTYKIGTHFERDIELKHIGFVPNWKRHLLSSPTDTW